MAEKLSIDKIIWDGPDRPVSLEIQNPLREYNVEVVIYGMSGQKVRT